MIQFQDPKLFVKGVCNAILRNTRSGDIEYQDNKFQSANITTGATIDPIRAGLGNPIAAIIASDSVVNVEASSAAFSLAAKAMQVGAVVAYNAVVDICEVIEASGSSIAVETDNGTPVAPYGFTTPICYVTEVGVQNLVASAGSAYAIDATTGAISGFTAVSGHTYKVWYFVAKASAQVATLSTQFTPGVYHFTAQMAVYEAQSGINDQSTRVGWLYVIVPRLALGAKADIAGNQTTPDTTNLSGQSMAYDPNVESATCADCDVSTQAYYIYAPDDTTSGIAGLAVVGGEISLPISTTAQIPVKYVMADGSLVQPNYSDLKFVLESPPSGTTVGLNTGIISASSTAGDCEVTISYPKTGTALFTCVANVNVTST